ncbi:MAG: GGDEF domain-containing protein [Lachnospiraceae bacterium]|nr:GGDEF domain-containing protein [Lachnospiraceae bacterium]
MDEMHYQIDLLKAMNEKLLGSEKMFRMICGTSSNAFLFYSFSEKRFETLGCWERYFEFEVKNSSDFQNILSCVKEKYSSDLETALFCERTGKTSCSAECEMADGSKWVEFEVTISYDDDSKPSEKIVRVRDITKAKKQTEDLKYMAYYDALTGLYNRNYFVRLLSEWVRKAQVEHTKISVMCMRLDEFRKINDSMGMIAGDEVVQLFGLFLKELQNEDVIVSHFYEDMFFVSVYDPFGNNTAERIFRKICERLEDTFYITSGSAEIKSTISVGVSEYPESARNSLELINCAEIVMLQKSEKGRNSIDYFEAPMLLDFMENIQLENQLKEAIESEDFELYYQPQYDSLSNKLRGVEALIRWRKHDGKLVSPAVFIPLAEKDGMIVQIGNWVLEEGIRSFKKWYDKYKYPMMLSLNISAIQYKRKDFVHKLLRLLEKYQVNPELIELEITESVLIDDFESVVEKLHTLKEYGIKISLDDFGTGFSSLSYLKGLPIDTLKIDKSFIDTVIEDNSTRVITESIIAMVKKLGCETVAEGVETQEQFEYLKGINCDNIQGFLLGKPMPASEVDKLLAAV